MWGNVMFIYKSVKSACVLFPFTHGTSENKTTGQWPGVSTENTVFPGYLRDGSRTCLNTKILTSLSYEVIWNLCTHSLQEEGHNPH